MSRGASTAVAAVVIAGVLPATASANPPVAESLGGDGSFMCVAESAGHAWCWGPNAKGNLGDRSILTAKSPVEVLRAISVPLTPDELTGVTGVSASVAHACAATEDGYAWCWGGNDSAELGDGTTIQRLGAVIVLKGSAALDGVVRVDTGAQHSCALREGGQAWCWGSGLDGRLGIGTTPVTSGPVRMRRAGGALTDVEEVVAGGAHTCARVAAGTVWCTGRNEFGALGDGSKVDRLKAVKVIRSGGAALTGVVDIDAGSARTCAATSTGAAWCWGQNEFTGAIGDGTFSGIRKVATRVIRSNGQPLAGISRIATGVEDSCAIGTSGQVWCWGHNYRGASGDGTQTPHARAVKVTRDDGSPFTGAIDIAVGRYFACAITADHTAWCWGSSKFGTIGDGGMTTNPSHPTPVDAPW